MPLLQDEVVIYFVQGESSSEDMKRAFLACQLADFKPKIKSEDEANDVPKAKNVVFVLEDFSGSTFKSLSSTDSLVVGPRCLHYCITNELSIPANDSPVFTMAMKGVTVSASRLSKSQKEELACLVGYMGGHYMHQLTSAVTHLLSNDGRSPKCEKAIEYKVPRMRSDWVKAVWEASKTRDVTAFDNEFFKYKLSPFTGMHVSCSNLLPAVKKKIQAAVEANGGVYMASLEQHKTTILIIGEPDGKKFQAAQLWGVPCLKADWIFDSVEKKMALPTKSYLITARPKCSTPTSDLPSFMSNADVSCIPLGGESVNHTVDETNSTLASTTSLKCLTKPVAKPPLGRPRMHEYKKFVEEINLSSAASAGLFLDGCRVFLSGFGNQDFDKMKKLINRSGATLFPEISDRLSHVIMGDFVPEHVKEIEKLNEKPHVVSVEWILASIRLKTAAPAEPYLCFNHPVNKNGPVPPASPLSHKGLSLLKSKVEKADSPKPVDSQENRSTSRKLFVKAPVLRRGISSQDDDPVSVVLNPSQKALPPDFCNSPLAQDLSRQEVLLPPPKSIPEVSSAKANETQDSSCTASSIDISPFFKDLVFLVIGFVDPTTIIESIFAVGGKVESAHFQGVADYAVIPLNGASTQMTATEVVTSLWVEDCYEQNKVVTVEYFHQPVPLKSDNTPLKGSVICASGFSGKERTFVFHLAEALGAKVQESFSRKDHPAKNIYKSTHLVCKTPTGSKYNAAVKWGIPVINESWLLACVSTATLAPVEPHRCTPKDGSIAIVVTAAQTPVNPIIQRLKAAEPDSTIVADTPVRAVTGKVDETNLKTQNISTNRCEPIEAPPTDDFVPTLLANDVSSTAVGEASNQNNITPRNSLVDGHNFVTPANNLKRMSVIGSAGKSPFHMDTPDSPYGRVFMEEGGNPSPDTRKKWKRFIDNLPDLYVGSPEVQQFRKRRPSTPLNVIMKQIWVKFGGAEIEGIDSSTGDLLPNGPYSDWVHENTSLVENNGEQSEDVENSRRENPVMSQESISKELSQLKSRLNSVLTPAQQNAAGNDVSAVQSTSQVDTACNTKAGSWITPKGMHKPMTQAEMQWDFGKPTISVANPDENACKKIRLSNFEDDKIISEQVSKLYENDKPDSPEKNKRIFVLSWMPAASREKFEGIIKSLGGEVSTSSSFEPRTTHLIVEKILRSEKLLCAVASGKWVLHSSYITQCYQSRMFLPEEDYEWGSERSLDRLPNMEPGTTEWNLAQAVHFWRVRRTDLGQPDAFRNFKAVILTSDNKLAQYTRLLQAGNATVLPKQRITEATHVFWDEDKVPLPVEKSVLKSHKIPLLKPVYLGDYLAKNPPPSLNDYMI